MIISSFSKQAAVEGFGQISDVDKKGLKQLKFEFTTEAETQGTVTTPKKMSFKQVAKDANPEQSEIAKAKNATKQSLSQESQSARTLSKNSNPEKGPEISL
jgi:hypothetical protein